MHLQLIHFALQQRPTQHCKPIILQLKNKCKKTIYKNQGTRLKWHKCFLAWDATGLERSPLFLKRVLLLRSVGLTSAASVSPRRHGNASFVTSVSVNLSSFGLFHHIPWMTCRLFWDMLMPAFKFGSVLWVPVSREVKDVYLFRFWDFSILQILYFQLRVCLAHRVLVAQSCPTLPNPMDCSPPGFSVHWILQARTLEWVAISFSRGPSPPRDRTWVSRIAGRFFTT